MPITRFAVHDEEAASSSAVIKGGSPSRISSPLVSASALSITGSADSPMSALKRHRVRSVDATIEQDKDIASFQGLYAPLWKTVLYYLLAAVTCGASLLWGHWAPSVQIWLSLVPCALRDATHVRITLVDRRVDVEPICQVDAQGVHAGAAAAKKQDDGRQNLLNWQATSVFKLLEYRCNRFLFVDTLGTFVPVPGLPKGFNEQLQRAANQMAAVPPTGVAAAAATHSDWDVADRQMRYGANEMRVPIKSLSRLIFEEMWHPFYVFQYFSILVWVIGDAYYSYSVCIFLITAFSILSSAVETHSNMKRLAEIAFFATEVAVVRGGTVMCLPSTALVPGDIIVVGPGALPCDAVLLAGECIVDENMLTGESVPVRKVCYSPVADGLSYHPDKTSACTLYGGTVVAQARAPRGQQVLAIVCRTRFYSAKGELLRSILYPREHSESFVSDSLKFICVMLALCMGLFLWAAIVLHSIGATPMRIVVRFFDMITIAVPPALPACLTIATVISIGRLRKAGIFVTGPDRITVAGMLDVICFDKTGTLTEQGLDLQGVVPISEDCVHAMVYQMQSLPPRTTALLASCHGLARLGSDLVGDPLDQKLFLATHWTLIDSHAAEAEGGGGDADAALRIAGAGGVKEGAEAAAATSSGDAADGGEGCGPSGHGTAVCPPGADPATGSHAIVRRFEFSAALQRNLVVVRAPSGEVSVFVKGSPEMVRTLATPSSIPPGFDAALGGYVRDGLRVLALACGDASQVPAHELQQWTQQEFESRIPLRMVGLAVMANPLRGDSAGVIAVLQRAGIRTAMVTGDHLRTGVSVAGKCGIMPSGRPICLVDGGVDAPEASTSAAPRVFTANGSFNASFSNQRREAVLSLTVLDPDGTTTPWVAGHGTAAARILSGEMECAVTGKGFDRLVASLDGVLLPVCLQHATVWARMSPDNKRDLMQLLGNGIDGLENSPKLGLHTGFCGDGANDCGALKAAHLGVSLCEAEASVAAPMTSRNQTIASMVTVVAEGRCTLMATYQIFQFIIGYALVQAFETNVMYTYALNVGDYQYLVEDLFFTTVLAAFMGFTKPRNKLSRQKPLSRVLSAPLIIGTAAQLVVVVLFQLLALWALRQQVGYTRTRGPSDLHQVVAPENTATYLIALSQFIILALVFNKGHPHRSPIYTNWALLTSIVVQTLFVVYSLFSIDRFNQKVQEIEGNDGLVTTHFRLILLGIMLANCVVAVFAMYLSQAVIWCHHQIRRKLAARAALAVSPPLLEMAPVSSYPMPASEGRRV